MQFVSSSGRSAMLITRVAAFVAVGVVSGLALAAIPNVELVTAVCFTAGFLLGGVGGVLTGALSEAVFSGFHPMGSSVGLLLIAQMTGMSLAGLFGSIARHFVLGRMIGWRYTIVVTSFGVLATILFDLLTNLAYPIAAGFDRSQTAMILAAGLPFAAIHAVSNTLVFTIVVSPILPRLNRILSPS